MSDNRPVEAASAAPGEKRAASRPAAPARQLARASESGDPAVQKLLADRWAAQQSGSGEQAAQIDAALAELGFE